MTKKRFCYLGFIIFVIILGLGSRKYSELLPVFIADYSGDALWALMIFFILRFIFPEQSTYKTAVISIIFSFAIEFSQLYEAEWINNIRNIKYAGLILGYGFLWSDLICYTTGILVGVLFEKYFTK